MTEHEWKAALKPYAQAFFDFERSVEERLRGCSDAELARLVDDMKRPTETNCWYAVYQVAEVLPAFVDRERCRRLMLQKVSE